MLPYLREHHGDPGRLHAEGHVTRVAVEDAREQVAALFGARPREVVFTASGTEAVNTAIWGAVERAAAADHIVTTAVEHSAVLDACRAGAGPRSPWSASTAPAGSTPTRCSTRSAPTPRWCRSSSPTTRSAPCSRRPTVVAQARASADVIVHVDACAAAGHVPVDFLALGADLCSVTGHKLGGPKGAGALLVRRGSAVPALRRGRGAGTRAARRHRERARDRRIRRRGGRARPDGGLEARSGRAPRALTDAPRRETLAAVPDVERFGDPDDAPARTWCASASTASKPSRSCSRSISTASPCTPGSSCSSETLEPSPVLAAMGVDADRSLRVSVGWSSTDADVDAFLAAFPGIVERFRRLRTHDSGSTHQSRRALRPRRRQARPSGTRRRLRVRSRRTDGVVRRVPSPRARPTITTISASSPSVSARRTRAGPGGALSPRVAGRLRSATSSTRARHLLGNGAYVGESDHGATKSIYGQDLDGNEFEVMWMVPREAWGDDAENAVSPAARPRVG